MVVALGSERATLLIVVVPEFLPMVIAVALPAKFNVETVALRRLKVLAVEVRLPPLTAMLPAVVMFPFEPVIVKCVALTLPVPSRSALVIAELERSIPFVIAPPPVDVIARAVGRVFDAFDYRFGPAG